MRALYALYPDGLSAQQAVDGLRAAGIADREMTVVSAQPMEDYAFGDMDKGTWMWWCACAGGLVGMSTGVWLTWLTETSWPINVGGLPIVAWWPNLIIIFELTMLGAILATFTTLVLTAGLGRSGTNLYDPEVSDGKILVGVENPREDVAVAVERALRTGPNARVKTVE